MLLAASQNHRPYMCVPTVLALDDQSGLADSLYLPEGRRGQRYHLFPGLLRLGSTYTFVGTHPVGRTSRARPPTWWWFRLLVLPWSFIHGRVRVPCRRAPALAEEGRESHPGPLDRDASRRQDDRFDGRVQVGGIGWSRSGHGSHPRGRHQHQRQRQARTGWGPGVAVVAGGGRWWWRRWWWLTSLWMQYTVTTLCRG